MNRITRVISVFITSGAILLSACSTNLGPETLPSTTASETEIETEPVITTEEIPEHSEPFSQAIIIGSIVESNGALSIEGTKLVNSMGDEVVLKGISTYGIEECGDFFTSEVVKTLAEDWGCDVLRIAITGNSESEDGYIADPDQYFDKVCKLVDMCVSQGIYVIVDWNVQYGEDMEVTNEAAVDFFSRLSAIYTDTPNLIYELNNDPVIVVEDESADSDADEADTDDEDTDDEDEDDEGSEGEDESDEDEEEILDPETEWDEYIKPLAEEVIDVIRENSESSVIIIGAPGYGLDIDVAAWYPLDYDNIAYGCRFYSGNNKKELREKIIEALDYEACVFITEWGLSDREGMGGIFIEESVEWIDFIDEQGISWCNYAIGTERIDDNNALQLFNDRYTDDQKYYGHWPDGLLSYSGSFAREQFLKVDETPEDDIDETEPTETSEE